jgi:hypothetical protein
MVSLTNIDLERKARAKLYLLRKMIEREIRLNQRLEQYLSNLRRRRK